MYDETLNTKTYEEQKDAIRRNGWNIEYIKNPSEELQKLAVQQNGLNIRYIENPSSLANLTLTTRGKPLLYFEFNGHPSISKNLFL